MPSVLPLVVRTSFRLNGRFHNDRFVTKVFKSIDACFRKVGQLRRLNCMVFWRLVKSPIGV